ncbi:MAG: hypothetical protein WCE87_03535 [Candidatus Udaeobacter sp.]
MRTNDHGTNVVVASPCRGGPGYWQLRTATQTRGYSAFFKMIALIG